MFGQRQDWILHRKSEETEENCSEGDEKENNLTEQVQFMAKYTSAFGQSDMDIHSDLLAVLFAPWGMSE